VIGIVRSVGVLLLSTQVPSGWQLVARSAKQEGVGGQAPPEPPELLGLPAVLSPALPAEPTEVVPPDPALFAPPELFMPAEPTLVLPPEPAPAAPFGVPPSLDEPPQAVRAIAIPTKDASE